MIFYLSLDGISLAVNDGVGSHNAEGSGVSLNYLELHCSHASSDDQHVVLVYWPVGLHEIRLQVNLEQVSAK